MVKKILYGLVGLALVGLMYMAFIQSGAISKSIFKIDNSVQIAAGKQIYAQSCASCHGANLQGQDNWKSPLPSGRLPAPPHNVDGHTWHHPDNMLLTIIKFGPAAIIGAGYENDMPAFEGILSDDEIIAVLEYIKSTWPERSQKYQIQMTQQAEVEQ
jgi:mono/diheme cytochrome c family protein